MKSLVSKLLLPMAVLGSFFAFLAARSANVNLELVVLSATVITLLVSIVLVRAMPFQKRWYNSQGDI
jgi:hypothetical protein